MSSSLPPSPPAGVDIRLLDTACAADYRAIRLAALRDAPDAFGSTYAIEAARPFEHFAERVATTRVFAVYLDGRIAGMIGYKRESGGKDRHKGFLWGMYVAPHAQRRGFAAALVEAALAAAATEVEQVTLSVVQGNDAARALYERLGFTLYGVEPRALKSANGYADELLMVKFLAAVS
ncbi:GNAT family N-acetyltransferase [Burkholderia alba]|uniref:GNAT family N-acetyltransferase n=1 Tax=Burkholderia alba TaxID=2683677 RepID=UPI002B05F931|nr:GNAT family N-acetyltransferase [Burkholderia alba]